MPCAQFVTLQTEWPCTLRVLTSSYLPTLENSTTDRDGKNPAGYVLFQLRRALRHAQGVHGEVRGGLAMCDQQFAAEVEYHATCHTQFRNVIPALGTCWFNLVHERSERFRGAAVVREAQPVQCGGVFSEIQIAARSCQA